MKLRFPSAPQQLLFAVGCACLLSADAFAQAPAGGTQATFKVRNQPVQQGTVLGASAAGVQIQIGTQVITLAPSMFESFQMAPPPAYAEGVKSYTARDFGKALAQIESVVVKYKGLPTDWAQYATGLLGQIYVDMNQLPKAEAAFQEFKKLYSAAGPAPGAEVGMARIDLAKKDYSAAKAKLDPIMAEALHEKSAPPGKALAYSQAFLVSGQIKEAEQNPQGALEDYLRTVTIFYHDRAAVAQAQEKADALRAKAKKDAPLTVP